MISPWGVGPSILMYHSIADNSDDPYAVSVDAFRKQLCWLTESGFNVVPLAYLVQSIQMENYRMLRKKVVITFDDGYEDFFTNALPILLDRAVPATVFLVTGMLGGKASWKDSANQQRLMSEDEVRCIKARGFSLGSHTATHANLTLLDSGKLQSQLSDSYDQLTRLGESFYAFSYPWGECSKEISEAVRASGYECAVAAGGKMLLDNVDTYLLPRITMGRNMDLKRFQSILTRTGVEMDIRRRCRATLNRFGRGERKALQ